MLRRGSHNNHSGTLSVLSATTQGFCMRDVASALRTSSGSHHVYMKKRPRELGKEHYSLTYDVRSLVSLIWPADTQTKGQWMIYFNELLSLQATNPLCTLCAPHPRPGLGDCAPVAPPVKLPLPSCGVVPVQRKREPCPCSCCVHEPTFYFDNENTWNVQSTYINPILPRSLPAQHVVLERTV